MLYVYYTLFMQFQCILLEILFFLRKKSSRSICILIQEKFRCMQYKFTWDPGLLTSGVRVSYSHPDWELCNLIMHGRWYLRPNLHMFLLCSSCVVISSRGKLCRGKQQLGDMFYSSHSTTQEQMICLSPGTLAPGKEREWFGTQNKSETCTSSTPVWWETHNLWMAE